jgi:hypothetical protein
VFTCNWDLGYVYKGLTYSTASLPKGLHEKNVFFTVLCLKRKVRLMRLFCPSVCPLKKLNQLVDFHGIQYGGHVIKAGIDCVLFNLVPLTNSKWTFKLLRWMQHLYQSAWGHEILYADRYSKDKQLLRPFL